MPLLSRVSKTEEQLRSNAGAILRAVRKYCALNQVSFAKQLDVSQSNISKYEGGISLPSAGEWVYFCEKYKINPTSLYSGKVDALRVPDNESPGNFHQSLFLRENINHIGGHKISTRYSKLMGSTVRVAYPFIKLMINKLGKKAFDEFCKSKKMDPSYFIIMSNPINILFIQDMTEILFDKGIISKIDDIKALHEHTSFNDYHSHLLSQGLLSFDNESTTQSTFLESFVKGLNSFYEVNSHYAYVSNKSIRVSDEKHLSDLPLTKSFQKFRGLYNLSHFEQLAKKSTFLTAPTIRTHAAGWSIEFS